MTVRIPLSAPDITEAEIDAVTAVMQTPNLSLGPELAAFESALAEYHSVRGRGCRQLRNRWSASGVDRVGHWRGRRGDHSLLCLYGRRQCDSSGASDAGLCGDRSITLNLSSSSSGAGHYAAHARYYRGSHFWRIPAEMDALLVLARRHGLVVIEDVCEAIGAEFATCPPRVGSFGDLAVFGFYPNKQLTTGEGGAVLARDPRHAVRLRSLRNQGRLPSVTGWITARWVTTIGLSELACALGRVQLSASRRLLHCGRGAAERYDVAPTAAFRS